MLKDKYNKKFKVHVIGHDPEKLIKKISNPNIIYYGYLKNFTDIESIFKKCSFGSALYDFNIKKKKIILSGKINDYFSHCIPVIASNNAYEKKIITQKKLGICSNNLADIAKYINDKSSNKKKYLKIIKNLYYYSKKCDESKNLTKFYNYLRKI
jgi:glycosyltransferase involved in cell wall biosynthesis